MGNRVERTGIAAQRGFGLSALSRDQLDTLHFATLHLLEVVGVKVEQAEAVERFHGAGARVERSGGGSRVRIPPHLVEDCVCWAPSSVVYWGRDRAADFVAEPNRVGFATFGECVNVMDPVTREHRGSTKADCGTVARIVDALDEICVMERTLCPGDQFPEVQPVHNLEAMLPNTSKHIFLGVGSRRNLDVMVEVAACAVGGDDPFRERPVFTANVCPTSPLTLVNHCCEAVMGCAELGLGIMIVPMSLAGGTSPVTLAGVIAQHNAEVLSALILAQITRRGTPCTYGSCTTIMDLRNAIAAVGAPEYGIINASVAQLARYYRLPSWVGGGLSDAKTPDAQSGYEFALNALTSALSGANVVYGAGALESGLTFDYAKLMLDRECIRNIRRVLGGVTVDDPHLAQEVIADVGPGGTFLEHDHTFAGMRNQSSGGLFDRRNREAWLAAGGRSATERAYEAARALLDAHEPVALPRGAVDAMERRVQEYEREVRTA